MATRFILADTETSGLGSSAGVCDIAWLELDEACNVLGEFQSLVDPQCPISAGASGVHGIVDADVVDAPTLDELFQEVLKNPFQGDEVVLIGHNIAFDLRYVKNHIPVVATICTLRLARRLFPESENHKLATLAFHLGLKKGESHRASGDVQTTFELLKTLVGVLNAPLSEMVKESAKPIKVAAMPFGKHKGTALSDLEPQYRRWLLGLEDLDPDLRATLEAL